MKTKILDFHSLRSVTNSQPIYKIERLLDARIFP
jgi:hypothetical protein